MRYFLEVAYKGTNYAGFQIQNNAVTIQSKVEEALYILFRTNFKLTGSSRTDAGVHALQNYFHFDSEVLIEERHKYNLNSILPFDIVVKSITQVSATAHSRFDAISREYKYYITTCKNAFSTETAWFYPYSINIELLQHVANHILSCTNYASFSKKNVQVNNYNCSVIESCWQQEGNSLIYTVKANRFLRGMVRALVATMLKVGRGKISIDQFEKIFSIDETGSVDFAAPCQGLFLVAVKYPFL